MRPLICQIRSGTPNTRLADYIHVVPPTPDAFTTTQLAPMLRIAENPEHAQLKRLNVTTLAMTITDHKALFDWQCTERSKGQMSAAYVDPMKRGTMVHRRIAKMVKLRGENQENEGKLVKIIDSEKNPGIKNYLKSALPVILEIQSPESAICEQKVRHPMLAYEGRFDAVVKYNDNWSILDWKTAPARSSFTTNGEYNIYSSRFVYQLAAYASAFNHDIRFETQPMVKSGMLVGLKEDGSSAEVLQIGEPEMEVTFGEVKEKLRDVWSKVSKTMENKRRKYVDFLYKP